uniref:Calponin-homology (CH) domain-containing protein n=1 Tax=Schistosoma mansoni TaxID=6183 RepID=A0A5K4F1X1_SCHMA
MKSDLLLWAQLFNQSSNDILPEQLTDGLLLNTIFGIIDERIDPDDRLCKTVTCVKDRLMNWKIMIQNLRNYYLEVLQEVITIRPPNIVLVSKIPDSAQADQELEKVLLFLLCAAVRCDRRDYFIRQIMENLNPDVQTGIMTCIKNVTECPTSIVSFEKLRSSDADILRTFRSVVNQLEDIYLEEIVQLLDELASLQSKFITLQARYQLASRSKTLGPTGLKERSVSTVSLGVDNSHSNSNGHFAISTPRLDEQTFLLRKKSDISDLNESFEQTNEHLNDGVFMNDNKANQIATTNNNISNVNELSEIGRMDSGLEVETTELDSIRSLYQPTDNLTPEILVMDMDKHHLSVELAETKAKLRRAHIEIEDQADQLVELQDHLFETRRELSQVKEERARLADAAYTARHWQDEVDALKQTAERVINLEAENEKLKERLHEIDYYKARCQQLTEDLEILSNEHSQWADKEEITYEYHHKITDLEKELNKTRCQLTETENARNSDLDLIKNLREELGKLKLEHYTHKKFMNSPNKLINSKDIVTDNNNNEKSNQIIQQKLQNRISFDANDDDLTTIEISANNHLQQQQQHLSQSNGLNCSLSDQLSESVTNRLNHLEEVNRRLNKELEMTKMLLVKAQSVNEVNIETEASLAEMKRENQLLTNKLERLETALSVQDERLCQLDLERMSFETDARKTRESLNTFKETSERHINELSRENDYLTETIKTLRGKNINDISSDERIARLEKENSVLGESVQNNVTCLARAELEISQLRHRLTKADELCKRLDSLTDERNQLSAELGAAKREITALKEACSKQTDLEIALVSAEGNCARLQTQLSTIRATCENSVNMENELIRLRQIETKCEQLQNALFTAIQKTAQVEVERDSLSTRLTNLKQSLHSQRLLDSENDEADDEEGGIVSLHDEEVDSGNKTGDSTEETSPECLGVTKLRRKTISMPPNLRHRDRRRRGGYISYETELGRMDSEIKRLEAERDTLRKNLEEIQAKLTNEEAAHESAMKESDERSKQKISQLDSEINHLKASIRLSDQEIRRLRRELRDSEADQHLSDAMEKIKQLESQIIKLNNTIKQNETQLKDCEQQRSELCQQINIEQKTVSALRNELIMEKIQLQKRNSELKCIQVCLEKYGLSEDWFNELSSKENSIEQTKLLDSFMENFIDQLTKNINIKNEEFDSIKQQMNGLQLKNSELLNQLKIKNEELEEYKKIQANNCTTNNTTDIAIKENSSILIQIKDRVIELERENARLNEALQNEIEQNENIKANNQNLEIRINTFQEQSVSVQRQLAELIATNARLQVENTTLHSQLDSFHGQNSNLSTRITELESEIHHLSNVLDTMHTSKSQLTTDYEQLQCLHEKLTQDYEQLIETLKTSKESQRQLKSEIQLANEQVNKLQTEANDVQRLKTALEQERGSLKGEVKQIVQFREENARLQSELNSLNAILTRERHEKTNILERNREIRHQLQDSEHRVEQLTNELQKYQKLEQALHNEMESLKTRLQMLTELNLKYEKENKSLLSQLQSLLNQNQEILASTLKNCENHVSQEGVLRERLLSMHRQKQQLEEKVMEQYRNGSSSKSDLTNQLLLESQRRLTLIQRARAALNKHHFPHNSEYNKNNLGYNTISTVHSQSSWLNDSYKSIPTIGQTSSTLHRYDKRLVPGSVSIYDRDPDEQSQEALKQFLKYLDDSSGTNTRPSSAIPPQISNHKQFGNHDFLLPIRANSGGLTMSPCIEKRSQSRLSSDRFTECMDSPISGRSSYSSSNGVKSQLTNPTHHFPHRIDKNILNFTENINTNEKKFNLNNTNGWLSNDDSHDRSICSSNSSSNGMNSQNLPSTERCEKQISEIVQIKATTDESNIVIHKNIISDTPTNINTRSPKPCLSRSSSLCYNKLNDPIYVQRALNSMASNNANSCQSTQIINNSLTNGCDNNPTNSGTAGLNNSKYFNNPTYIQHTGKSYESNTSSKSENNQKSMPSSKNSNYNINSMATNCTESIPIFDHHKTSNMSKSALLREQFFSSMIGEADRNQQTQQHQSLESSSDSPRKPKVLLQYRDL